MFVTDFCAPAHDRKPAGNVLGHFSCPHSAFDAHRERFGPLFVPARHLVSSPGTFWGRCTTFLGKVDFYAGDLPHLLRGPSPKATYLAYRKAVYGRLSGQVCKLNTHLARRSKTPSPKGSLRKE